MQILIVEDDNSIRDILIQYLHGVKDHSCDAAKNESEARIMIKEKHYDLIVLDLLLDGVLSVSLIEYARHLWLNQPPQVCIISAMTGGDKIALENKADRFLAKPFTFEMFDELVSQQNSN